ncbi:MAG TPA: helix-turn-helix transcriptional regulator [Acidobacteriota bacterium]|jgi:DNA-binding XRE family transcriptional regulator
MTTNVVYVRGAERMVTAARLAADGLYVRFADDREGVIPLRELKLPDAPERVTVPRPHVILIHLSEGGVEEIPWDFARHFVDAGYRERSEQAAVRGREVFAERLRTLRSEAGMTQHDLSHRSGVSRVTIARLESGVQLPRYKTLAELAKGLGLPIETLIAGPGARHL